MEELETKVNLLKKFRDYLNETSKNISKLQLKPEADLDEVLVKSWKKGKWGILFILSGGLVQGNFTDGSEIFINSNTKDVAFINQKGSLKVAGLDSLDSILGSEMH